MNPELDVRPESDVAYIDGAEEIVDATAVPSPRSESPASHRLRVVELLAWLGMIGLADVAIYRGGGFAGWAAVLGGAPLLLTLGARTRHWGAATAITGLMLALAAARLIWCGSALLAVSGCVLLAAFGLALAGGMPYFVELAAFVGLLAASGAQWFREQVQSIGGRTWRVSPLGLVNVLIPAIVLAAFAGLFVLANPDLLKWLGEQANQALEQLAELFARGAPHATEVLFCGCMAWIAAGLLRPKLLRTRPQSAYPVKPPAASTPALLFAAFRNTLIAVSGLFAVYLVFEFQTLWFRKFPPGFHYSGYAHEGAAWLTVALALSTLVLSGMFQGPILRDSRLPQLRRLAWLWSLENFILVAAVYHRMFIYVGFNGMTRMRMVGLFGISAVAVGFAIVLWKIARDRDFLWLVRRQIWALGLAIFLFCLTPIDAITSSYNVRRILSGDPAPSVQLIVHPIDAEGITWLLPLTTCENDRIREGVKALLADHDRRLQERLSRFDWSQFQGAEQEAGYQFARERGRWAEYTAPALCEEQLRKFHAYAYQWY
jgi:hypothetical protein